MQNQLRRSGADALAGAAAPKESDWLQVMKDSVIDRSRALGPPSTQQNHWNRGDHDPAF
jgi:hypothetical protein